MVVCVDPQGVDRLNTSGLDRRDLGVVVVAGHQRSYDVAHLLRGDPLEDGRGASLPALDPIDVVAPQPVTLGIRGASFGANVVSHMGHMIVAKRAARNRYAGQQPLQLRLLYTEEPDALSEKAGVAAVGDNDLDLARRGVTES